MGKAFAVGGKPQQRGVVASCSYPARKLGIHSAMPMAQAIRLYPRLLIVAPRHTLYYKYSRQVMELLKRSTDLVEQISIDEAFLDLSSLPESAEVLAKRLQETILQELQLPCSLGAATNKLVAKIATDFGKAAARGEIPPNAITIVPPGQEAAFLAPLPVRALWGVGPKTEARLAEMNILTMGDLASLPEKELVRVFGKPGYDLSVHARGIDDRPVTTYHETKSISQEITFARDIRDAKLLHNTITKLVRQVSARLREENLYGSTVKLKLRWPDFTTISRQSTLPSPTDQEKQIQEIALHLLNEVWTPGKAVRLIGVGISNLRPPIRQLELWSEADHEGERGRQIQSVLDTLKDKFGDQVVRLGSDRKDKL